MVRLVNEKWIPVHVDRDRRPDIDIRYQLAVFIVARGETGWPLTAFLAPSGETLFGGGYIPVEDRMQKAGMRSLLENIASLYQRHPEAAEGTLRVVRMAFERTDDTHREPVVGPEILEEVGKSLLATLDREYGGFGGVPRIPRPFAVELAGTLYHRTKDPAMLDAVVKTLNGMERGSMYDRVGGGFHRITTDAAWRYPEFEKLTTYNATILRNYLMGYEATGDEVYRRTAERTLDYMLATLADPDGGFYVGQRASRNGSEPVGIHYAWSEEEFLRAVPEKLHKIALMLFRITREGELVLGEPPRNLLYLAADRSDAAGRLGIPLAEVFRAEAEIVAALAKARAAREAPIVEREIYVDSSALGALAMLDAWRVLGRQDARDAAVATMNRLIAALRPDGALLHRVHPAPVPGRDVALALDHVTLADAALLAWEELGDERYLSAARELAARTMALFWDDADGGLFDVISDPNAPGYLSIRRRLTKDLAYPSLNAGAARILDRLWMHTGESSYRDRARSCLGKLVSITKDVDARDAGLGLAVESHLRPATRYVVVGPAGDEKADDLYAAARRIFDPGKLVTRLEPGRDDEAIARLGATAGGTAYVVACSGGTCSAPATDPGGIAPPPAVAP